MSIQKTLSRIRSTGVSDYEIADLIGISQPQINRIRRGLTKNTSFDTGEKINALEKELFPCCHENKP